MGFVVIDPVILVKQHLAEHLRDVSRNDLEMPAWSKRKSEVVASQGQGRRAVRQAVAEGGSDRDVHQRLVEVLDVVSIAETDSS